MHRPSFLHPNYAYQISNTRSTQPEPPPQTPDIFVVPPEEDQTPPWCCYNSQQRLADDDDTDSLRFPQASSHTPYFHRDAPGIDGLILPSRKSSETRSIVDALGDADDFSDHEPMGMDYGEDEEDDGILPEMDTHYGRARQNRHFDQEFGVHLPTPLPETDNDSDIVEIVKVRRKSAFINDPNNNDIFASSSSFGTTATLRSRASKAFQSLRGSLRTSSRTTSKYNEFGGSLSRPRSKPLLKLQPKSKSQSKPRAQDIFSPIENVPLPARSQTPDLLRRPSSRISEFFTPTLKRRASTTALFSSKSKQPATTPHAHEPPAKLSRQKSSSRPSKGSTTPPRRSSSSTRTHQELTSTEQDDVPTPTRDHYQRRSEDDQPTPSRHSSESRNTVLHDSPRSTSPSPAPRVNPPPLGNRQAKKGFSVLNLHKLFHKSAPQKSPDALPHPMRQASTSSSTCPSLSSTHTSEWSGRNSPTTDSVPQTPTGFDENEVRRTIVPVQSTSTVGSGINLGSSLQSGAVSLSSSSSISSDDTAATPGHSYSAPDNSSAKGSVVQTNSPSYDVATISGSESTQPRPSMASSRSAVSTSTAGGVGSSTSSRVSESTISRSMVAPSPEPEFDVALQLDLDLDLGLGINMTPSASGGMLSSNDMGSTATSTLRKIPGRTNRSRSLSLKNIGNKLGIGKQDTPPVPPLPGQGDVEEFDMRLDSLHFDEMSFDADRFIGIAH